MSTRCRIIVGKPEEYVPPHPLRDQRVKVGMSQREAACAVDMQPHHLNEIEHGRVTPTIEEYARLEALYKSQGSK